MSPDLGTNREQRAAPGREGSPAALGRSQASRCPALPLGSEGLVRKSCSMLFRAGHQHTFFRWVAGTIPTLTLRLSGQIQVTFQWSRGVFSSHGGNQLWRCFWQVLLHLTKLHPMQLIILSSHPHLNPIPVSHQFLSS